MKTFILPVLLMVALTGCFGKQNVRVEYVDRPYPVPSVPKPPRVDRPVLEIDKLSQSERANIGSTVKALVVSLQQQREYSAILEEIIQIYEQMAIKSEIIIELLPGATTGTDALIFSTTQDQTEVKPTPDVMRLINPDLEKMRRLRERVEAE